MNDRQRQVLIVAAVVTGLMLIFPPFEFVGANGLTLNRGFSFIFSPPNMASVNISQLFVQWVGVWVVAAVAIHLRRS